MRKRALRLGPRAACSASDQKWKTPVKKQVLVSVDRGETRVALLEAAGTPGASKRRAGAPSADPARGYRVAELYLERRGSRSIVGNIYKGVVDNVLVGLEAAF